DSYPVFIRANAGNMRWGQGKPRWHLGCFSSLDRNTTFRRRKKVVVMKTESFFFWSVFLFLSAAALDATGEARQAYALPDRYIVVLKPGHQPSDVASKHGVKARHVFDHALHGFAGDISADRLEALRQDPSVEWVEPELELFSS